MNMLESNLNKISMKICSRCEDFLPITEFRGRYSETRKKKLYGSICMKCRIEEKELLIAVKKSLSIST